jgi:hypothetical protein
MSRTLSAILFFQEPHSVLVNIAFRFSDCGLSLDPVLHRVVVRPSNHLTFSVSGGIMIRPSKRPRLLQPREISELIVDTATLLPNNQLSRVQQFSFVQCRWQRGCWWEWARWTDSTGSNPTMDMLLLPSEKYSTHIYRVPQRKEGQWSISHKWRLKSAYRFPSVICRNYHSAGGGD